MKLVLFGGAGLVGQNLVARLARRADLELVVIDKHRHNLAILRRLQPQVETIEADLAEPGPWREALAGARSAIMLQAQIGATEEAPFRRNNVTATDHILAACREYGLPQLIHVSSSVVNSKADDFYTRSKTEQEQLVLASGLPCIVLRPTLMFGWFDRKHLGWLSRFMRRVPVFPIPGHGRYMRQPLYAGDFCNIVISVLDSGRTGGVYDISGLEQRDYIDLIRDIRRVTRARTAIVRIPYGLFRALLATWALFDRNPPFTTAQLEALVADDEFEVIDWPGEFGVTPTPLATALEETFNHPDYAREVLAF